MPNESGFFFLDLHQRVEEVFEEIVYRRWPTASAIEWRPVVDVYETPEAYLVVIDLPGVVPETVQLTVSERTLTVTGHRALSQPGGLLSSRCERNCGQFRRVIEFAEVVDKTQAKSEYHLGTYSILLPKYSRNTFSGTSRSSLTDGDSIAKPSGN